MIHDRDAEGKGALNSNISRSLLSDLSELCVSVVKSA
jgi:hypothetical protein